MAKVAENSQEIAVGGTLASGARRRVHPLYWVCSLLIAGVLLYWSIRGIEWPRIWTALLSAKLPFVAAYVTFYSITLFIRAYRWRILLTAEGHVDTSTAFWATSAGYFGNNFLPARAGEVVRTLYISSTTGLAKTFVLTTAVSERMTDAVVLVAISAVILLNVQSPPGWLSTAAKPLGIAGLLGVAAIAIVPLLQQFLKRLISHIPVRSSVRDRITGIMDQALLGLRSYHNGRRLFGFVTLTCVIWCMDAAMTVIGARALNLTMPVSVAFLLIAGLGVGSALPSTPGYVGVYQFVAVSILVPFGFTRTDAILYILFAQAVAYSVIGIWGLLGIWKLHRLDAALNTSRLQSASQSS